MSQPRENLSRETEIIKITNESTCAKKDIIYKEKFTESAYYLATAGEKSLNFMFGH